MDGVDRMDGVDGVDRVDGVDGVDGMDVVMNSFSREDDTSRWRVRLFLE